jgi:hypothetical protein
VSDRADVLVTALWQIAAMAIRARLDGGSETVLRAARAAAVELVRTELANLERQVRKDIRLQKNRINARPSAPAST